MTYFGGAGLHTGHPALAGAVGLLLIKGQILQALGEGQFLLDGHSQEGVERLLLVLGCSQLPLHLVQLGYILVTPKERDV